MPKSPGGHVKKTLAYFLLAIILIALLGFLLPQTLIIPVVETTPKSWNPKSFWHPGWGSSVTHKGIDIFARERALVIAPTYGFILYTGTIAKGGNVVLMLGPKWRLHYFAHLNEIKTDTFRFLRTGDKIGTVGTTGNAKGTPRHLHYTIATLAPYFWKMDNSQQGWLKPFYLNPIEYLPT